MGISKQLGETCEVGDHDSGYAKTGTTVALGSISLSFLSNFVFETDLLCVVVAVLELAL